MLLRDDKSLQLADHVAPIVREDLIQKVPAVVVLLDKVTEKITTADLAELNRRVGNEKQTARAAAEVWLKAKGLVG